MKRTVLKKLKLIKNFSDGGHKFVGIDKLGKYYVIDLKEPVLDTFKQGDIVPVWVTNSYDNFERIKLTLNGVSITEYLTKIKDVDYLKESLYKNEIKDFFKDMMEVDYSYGKNKNTFNFHKDLELLKEEYDKTDSVIYKNILDLVNYLYSKYINPELWPNHSTLDYLKFTDGGSPIFKDNNGRVYLPNNKDGLFKRALGNKEFINGKYYLMYIPKEYETYGICQKFVGENTIANTIKNIINSINNDNEEVNEFIKITKDKNNLEYDIDLIKYLSEFIR